MTWFLPEPMLTVAVDNPVLHAGWAAEPQWDGYRAQLAVYAGGRVLLRSRRGTDMTAAFPEIKAAALTQLPADTGLDGELVVWEEDRLACERPQQRLARRDPLAAAEAARQWPAHYVAFDLVHAAGTDLTGWPYQRRRAALEALFTDHQLSAPLTLCPSTTDPAEAAQRLGWTAAGLEGLCFKRLTGPYRPVRSWQKYKVRVTTEAIIGAITGPTDAPRTVLLGRYDNAGRLQYTGRTTTLSPRRGAHPWEGWTFSAGWGAQRTFEVVLVEPEVVLEVAVDVAGDGAGRFRQAARAHRVGIDVDPAQVALFGEGPGPP
ncbi:ATP-dependent DNA ligase [Streptomyces sp. SID4946]|uniref:ATP-dependent DNA ligase n=1 Tax=Streptomyces sp. LamerLS-31b TaxID=1839765 RepID=UPI00081DC662|nr:MULTISPECIES: ATP-dependent DNA ligase [unclassified Streptomyces]MYQ96890.1 ATP-dependent DNA ligase [Streptomyces sp. SID4946]SCG02576.1 ATP dependent DNA ligase domain-containing protein [Streptomyces sp. DconLS]SCG06165.1 ATP dependent DNA ligase domain-containing protein [Streptomyces sp. LamerLS-31b]